MFTSDFSILYYNYSFFNKMLSDINKNNYYKSFLFVINLIASTNIITFDMFLRINNECLLSLLFDRY
jgi:hypothetical protein